MIVIVKKVKESPFEKVVDFGTVSVPYFWYTALRKADGITFQFGSGGSPEYWNLEIGKEIDLPVIKIERKDGSYAYRLPLREEEESSA